MDKLIKDKILGLVLIIIIVLGGGYFSFTTWQQYSEISSQKAEQQAQLETKQQELEKLQNEKKASEAQEVKKTVSTSGKIIYEVPGQQFTAEASFGIMFENLLANISNSGIRIRSIRYNYSPSNDRIITATQESGGGYNACELSFVAVGNYAQFQNFFKSLAKEKYLSNIYEIYIEPYDKDKTILINRFKVRLYTKTI